MNIDPASVNRELSYLILYFIISIIVLAAYLWLSRKARKEWMILMGELKPKITYEWERRQYIRLGTVFPVEFQKMDHKELGPLIEGFTRDISRNGIKIEAKTLHGRTLGDIVPDRTKLKLIINMPLYAAPVEAVGTVKWIQKLEEAPLDKYAIGLSYDDIREEDASRIIQYALWLYRRPVFMASVITLLILVIVVLSGLVSNLRTSGRQLQEKVDAAYQEKKALVERIKKAELERSKLDAESRYIIESEKAAEEGPSEKTRASDLKSELEYTLIEKAELQEKLDQLEESSYLETSEEKEKSAQEAVEEEKKEEAKEGGGEETYGARTEPESMPENGITDKMIEDEATTYRKFRDYILKEDIQLLDRYCYQHKSSLYHAASLFALAELRYKHRYDWVAVENAYKEVIRSYPKSKYASYASHRLDQVKRRLPYEVYTLKYYYTVYDLAPLLDYREITPYKK